MVPNSLSGDKGLLNFRLEMCFADNIFILIFSLKLTSVQISLQFVPECQIVNTPAIVQVMGWRLEQAIIWVDQDVDQDVWNHMASLGLNDLNVYLISRILSHECSNSLSTCGVVIAWKCICKTAFNHRLEAHDGSISSS